jgi:hypothetical protein
MSRLLPRPYPCLVIRQIVPRSPASVARALRVLEACEPVTTNGQDLRQWYLALLRHAPTWRSWPPCTPVKVLWPRVAPRQLELALQEAS